MISVWQRMKRVLNANAHANVDRLEQPEAMLNQLQRELASALTQAKVASAQSRAWQARLRAQASDLERRAEVAAQAARRAVTDGDDELGRQAIGRRQQHESELLKLNQQSVQADRLVARQQDQLAQLKNQLLELREKRASLLQRERFAQAMQTVTAIGDEMSEPIGMVIERMEERVSMHEATAEAMATGELDSASDERQLDDYIAGQSIDDELTALKNQINLEKDHE